MLLQPPSQDARGSGCLMLPPASRPRVDGGGSGSLPSSPSLHTKASCRHGTKRLTGITTFPRGLSGYQESRTQESSGVRMLGKNSGDRTHTVSRTAGLSIFPRELLHAGVRSFPSQSVSHLGNPQVLRVGPQLWCTTPRGKEVVDSTRGQGQGHRALQSSWVGRAGGGGQKPVPLRACPAGRVEARPGV